MSFRTLVLSAAFAAVAGSALAQSQPYEQVEAPKTWRVDVGGGITHGFSATGNTGDDVNYTAWGSASYRDIIYANGLDGLGWKRSRPTTSAPASSFVPASPPATSRPPTWSGPTSAPMRRFTPTSAWAAWSWAAAWPRTCRATTPACSISPPSATSA